MEKEQSLRQLIASADDLQLGSSTHKPSHAVRSSSCISVATCSSDRQVTNYKHVKAGSHVKEKAPSLLGLCLSILGKHLEDIIDDICELASLFPTNIRMPIASIARRRKLLNDEILTALAEDAWDILDISGSDVSDTGFITVIERCKKLRAVDISGCAKITEAGVSRVLQDCPSMETLRWGGCSGSDFTARGCLNMLKPKLHDTDGESWEDLDVTEITQPHSLRWLVWPTIDEQSRQFLAAECPRIALNPKLEPFGLRGQVPREALNASLDDPVVREVDPNVWATARRPLLALAISPNPHSTNRYTLSDELPIAEKFRLAFVERDARLAPKRAKNARQHKRREEKEWLMSSAGAKSIELAARMTKALRCNKAKR